MADITRNEAGDRLYATAEGQEGLFTAAQAGEAGYSAQLLGHHRRRGTFRRVRRGIYRLVRFPPGEHEDLVVAWLWAERAGTLSHDTALGLHQLSEILPAKVHLTLPVEWRKRRLRVPQGFVLHYADLVPREIVWQGPVPITSVERTLNDCAAASLSPELLRAASAQALARGLVDRYQLGGVARALEHFGGLP
jgi:predicted transcriptional regulator of viral defense system